MTTEREEITFVGGFPPPLTGASQNMLRIAKLCSLGMEVRTLNCSPIVGRGRLVYHISKIARNSRAAFMIWRDRPRLVYAVPDAGLGLWYNILLAVFYRMVGSTVFLHHRSYAYISRRSVLMAMLIAALGSRCRNIFLSDGMRSMFSRSYPGGNRGMLCGNAAFISLSTSAPRRVLGDPVRIGILSNLTIEKGIGRFVSFLRYCIDNSMDVAGIVAGPIMDNETAEILNQAKIDLGSRISILGSLSADERDEYFQGIDLFVFPTEYSVEAQPNVLFEAMSNGVPCFAFDKGAIREDIAGHGTSVVDPTEDYKSIWADKISKYVKNRDSYKEDSEAAFARIAELSGMHRTQLEVLCDVLRREGEGSM